MIPGEAAIRRSPQDAEVHEAVEVALKGSASQPEHALEMPAVRPCFWT